MVEEDDSHDFPPLIEFSDKPTGTIGFDAQPCWSGSSGYAGFQKDLRLTAPMRHQWPPRPCIRRGTGSKLSLSSTFSVCLVSVGQKLAFCCHIQWRNCQQAAL